MASPRSSTSSIDLSSDSLAIRFSLKPHHTHPSILEYVTLRLVDSLLGHVSTLRALRVNRYRVQDQFHSILDLEDDPGVSALATKLFDKFGCMRPVHLQHPWLRGTGCWGAELNDGKIVYIQDITVNERFRGQGIGYTTLQSFIRSDFVTSRDWVFCHPSPIPETRTTMRERLQLTPLCTKLFRNSGFRRIGRTSYLAYAPKPSHPSRRLFPIDDIQRSSELLFYSNHPNLILDAYEDIPPSSLVYHPNLDAKDEEEESAYPIHYAISTIKDTSITPILKQVYASHPEVMVRMQDGRGESVLHAAVRWGNVVAVRTLLDLRATKVRGVGLGKRKDPVEMLLNNRDNVDGLTPLELCRDLMECERSRVELGGGEWSGYERKWLWIEVMLKKALGVDCGEEVKVVRGEEKGFGISEMEYVKRNKWGCTCGSCLDGWLSPRMRERLREQAAVVYDTMGDVLEDRHLWDLICDNPQHDIALPYVPPRLIQPIVVKTFYKGLRLLFFAIHYLLEDTHPNHKSPIRPLGPLTPTPNTILDNLEYEDGSFGFGFGFVEMQAFDYFLKSGGFVEFGLDAVCGMAKEGMGSVWERGVVPCQKVVTFSPPPPLVLGRERRKVREVGEKMRRVRRDSDSGVAIWFSSSEDEDSDDEDEDDELSLTECGDQDEKEGEADAELPRCANDLEFGLVRARLGLSSSVRWGPYVEAEEFDVDVDGVTKLGTGGDDSEGEFDSGFYAW